MSDRFRCTECGRTFDTEADADFHVSEAPRVIEIERVPAMSDPRVEAEALLQMFYDVKRGSAQVGDFETRFVQFVESLRVDAVSSQYEVMGYACGCSPDRVSPKSDAGWCDVGCGRDYNRMTPSFRRIEHSADTRTLIEHRTPAETAEAKAWSDDAHARIRAGEVSGSHDLMREKVRLYSANTQEGT